MEQTLGLYLHIPFCRARCKYCDFTTFAGQEKWHGPYCQALRQEIALQAKRATGLQVDTVYFGGGTPTALSVSRLVELLTEIDKHFSLSPQAEISLEANPGTVCVKGLRELRQAGFNRISFGVQSLNDHLLQSMGRIHDREMALTSISMAMEAGFDNINADVLFDFPNQTLDAVQNTLRELSSLEIPHLSAYGLKVEDGTPLASELEQGKCDLPSEETQAEVYEWLTEYLPSQGYIRYEISNYAHPGQECRHNLKYWQYQPYLGLGVSAVSFWQQNRFTNTNDCALYCNKLKSGVLPVMDSEELSAPIVWAEYCFLALRTAKGLSIQAFSEYFQQDFTNLFAPVVRSLVRKGLLVEQEGILYLTSLGMRFGNQVFCEFLP